MKRTLLGLVLLLLVSRPAFAVYEVGQPVARDMCWLTLYDYQICVGDIRDSVVVLLYNAGWCGPCNDEFQELGRRVGEYKDKPVIFISLSASGWTQSQAPDQQFLGEWQKKHNISFLVAASPKDAGKKFFEPPLYIPSVAILDHDGKLAYKAVSPGISAILSQVDTLVTQVPKRVNYRR